MKMNYKRHPFLCAEPRDKIYLAIVFFVCLFAFVITLYPFLYVLAVSFSGSKPVYRGEVFLWPVDVTFEGYKHVIRQTGFWIAYGNTLEYTFVGTALNIVATTIAAYPLSRQRFFARRFFNFLIAFTMYFGGGMIPSYIVNTSLGLYNSRWVMWLPGLVSTYNIMICRSAFSAIPNELMESAEIDGAGPVRKFVSITLPYMIFVTTPATITTFVGNINNFNVIYLLTAGGPASLDYYQAGKTDLLVMWLYKLTVDQHDYALASTIGIFIFMIVSVCSLTIYNRSNAVRKEDMFQ